MKHLSLVISSLVLIPLSGLSQSVEIRRANSSALQSGNTVYLDATYGNDTSASRSGGTPFLSWTNAVAAMQNNDTLVVRPGRYFVNTFGSPSITAAVSNGPAASIIDKTNITIRGEGMPTLFYSNNIYMLRLVRVKNFKIDGLSFEATNKSAGANLTNLVTCIDLAEGTANGSIINSRFINFPDHGITSSLAVGGAGRQGVSNILVSANYFYGGGATSNVPALGFDGTAIAPACNWSIVNNFFEFCTRGVEYQVNTTEEFHGGICSLNLFRGMIGESIVFIGNGSSDTMTDINITGNLFHQQNNTFTSQTAIRSISGGMTRLTITGNTISEYGGGNVLSYGINLGSADGSIIKDCVLSDNQINGVGGDGITVLAGAGTIVTNISFFNNLVRNAGSRGIYYNGSGGEIIGNQIVASAIWGIGLDANAGIYGRFVKVRDNIIRDIPSYYGIYMPLGASNNLVEGNRIERTSQAIHDLNPIGHNLLGVNYNAGLGFQGTTNEVRGSTATFKYMGPLFTNFLSTANGAGTETVLFTNTLGINSFNFSGEALTISAGGLYGATANAKLLVLRLQNMIVLTNNNSINDGRWFLEATITRSTTSVTNFDIIARLNTSSAAVQTANWTNVTLTVTNTFTPLGISLTGNGVGAGDITGKFWKGYWEPSP